IRKERNLCGRQRNTGAVFVADLGASLRVGVIDVEKRVAEVVAESESGHVVQVVGAYVPLAVERIQRSAGSAAKRFEIRGGQIRPADDAGVVLDSRLLHGRGLI